MAPKQYVRLSSPDPFDDIDLASTRGPVSRPVPQLFDAAHKKNDRNTTTASLERVRTVVKSAGVRVSKRRKEIMDRQALDEKTPTKAPAYRFPLLNGTARGDDIGPAFAPADRSPIHAPWRKVKDDHLNAINHSPNVTALGEQTSQVLDDMEGDVEVTEAGSPDKQEEEKDWSLVGLYDGWTVFPPSVFSFLTSHDDVRLPNFEGMDMPINPEADESEWIIFVSNRGERPHEKPEGWEEPSENSRTNGSDQPDTPTSLRSELRMLATSDLSLSRESTVSGWRTRTSSIGTSSSRASPEMEEVQWLLGVKKLGNSLKLQAKSTRGTSGVSSPLRRSIDYTSAD